MRTFLGAISTKPYSQVTSVNAPQKPLQSTRSPCDIAGDSTTQLNLVACEKPLLSHQALAAPWPQPPSCEVKHQLTCAPLILGSRNVLTRPVGLAGTAARIAGLIVLC